MLLLRSRRTVPGEIPFLVADSETLHRRFLGGPPHVTPALLIDAATRIEPDGLAVAKSLDLHPASPSVEHLRRTISHRYPERYDLKLWMRDLHEGAAYLPH
jgi:hypothetical protein